MTEQTMTRPALLLTARDLARDELPQRLYGTYTYLEFERCPWLLERFFAHEHGMLLFQRIYRVLHKVAHFFSWLYWSLVRCEQLYMRQHKHSAKPEYLHRWMEKWRADVNVGRAARGEELA